MLVEGVLDLLTGDVFVAVEAAGVDGVQDGDAVPGAGGNLGGRAGGGQPQRQGGVPQVVRPAGQAGGGQDGAERVAAGGMPGADVDRFAEHAAAGAAEQPPVGCRAEPVQVLAQQRDQDRWNRDDPDRAVGRCLRPRDADIKDIHG